MAIFLAIILKLGREFILIIRKKQRIYKVFYKLFIEHRKYNLNLIEVLINISKEKYHFLKLIFSVAELIAFIQSYHETY